MITSEPYPSTLAYLHDYFALLALRLHRQVILTRLMRGEGQNDAFLGLFLSEDEISTILNELHGVSVPLSGELTLLDSAEEALVTRINERLAASDKRLRPAQLALLFDLSPMAVELLLLLLALEVDNRFARVYAYLQDDVARRWLSPALAIRLLPGASPTDAHVRALFLPGSPLLTHRLIHTGSGESAQTPLLDRPLRLDDRIAEYLLDHDPIDPALGDFVRLAPHEEMVEFHQVDDPIHTQLENIARLWTTPDRTALFLWGARGSGKTACAMRIAQRVSCPLLTLDAARLADQPSERSDEILHRSRREAQLRQALLLVRHADALEGERWPLLLRHLQPGMILTAQRQLYFDDLAQPPLTIHFAPLPHQLRRLVWQQALNGHARLQRGVTEELAGRFQLTAGQIERAAALAQQHAWLRAGPGATPDREDLFAGCRQQSNPNLARLARKVVTPFGWDDLVLPEMQLGLLHAIEAQVRHTHLVHREWGFDHKLALGKGLNALFSGQPGTGKTMAAGILAQSLGLDLYKIDLSSVVSKYIGETEKNLSQIFAEASTANVVLFFDEADALFGKRSEVKDAHDRYANIEISYLLQKMEEYDGVTILATNLSQNIDEAFARRMHFWIDFPFPTVADRERIWRGVFPPQAPCADDIDFAFLASQFELAGGNIRNCVLGGAFLAAEEGVPIGMTHLLQAVVRELNKLGRPITRANFADYYPLIRRSRL
jgi:AAA+ superfamily predicted ATPase